MIFDANFNLVYGVRYGEEPGLKTWLFQARSVFDGRGRIYVTQGVQARRWSRRPQRQSSSPEAPYHSFGPRPATNRPAAPATATATPFQSCGSPALAGSFHPWTAEFYPEYSGDRQHLRRHLPGIDFKIAHFRTHMLSRGVADSFWTRNCIHAKESGAVHQTARPPIIPEDGNEDHRDSVLPSCGRRSLLLLAGGTPQAFHSGGVAECGGCHSMHSPEAGGSFLLIGTDQSSTCLTCHEHAGDTGPRSYHVSTRRRRHAGRARLRCSGRRAATSAG